METILVLDLGSQHSQVIARKVRQCKVYCEIVTGEQVISEIQRLQPKGLILSHGHGGGQLDEPEVPVELFELGIPVLGIGFGFQLMTSLLGGECGTTSSEVIEEELLLVGADSLFEKCKLGEQFTARLYRAAAVTTAAPGFTVLARTPDGGVAAAADAARRLYGVQFEPDAELLQDFLTRICGCSGSWTMGAFAEAAVADIRRRVGSGRVICGLSGGVDSSVAAVLVQRAVGDQLTCIFVDHGLMRKGEPEQVVTTFGERFQMNLVHVDARQRFLSKLAGVTDPEQKRKIIGEEFIRVFEEEARKVGDAQFLVQGTVYPDVIESGTKHAGVVKSHHNVGGLPEDLRFELVEPLRQLFKDEVRCLAEVLGLPEEIAWRHPFPGPGLGVRVVGEVTPEKLEILREADAIALEEIRAAGLYREIWQAFVVLTDTLTVGVRDGVRTYEYAAAIRAVASEDAMTAQWVRLPYEVLDRISFRILHEVRGINRVVYDISAKPPATIEWE